MECKTIFVSFIITALGIAVAAAGFVAEARKVKKNQPTLFWVGLEPECEYPSSPAMGLAIAAAVALVIARAIITSTTGGCCSCCVRASPNRHKIFGRVCIVVSWITSSIAVVLFLAGAKLSSQNRAATVVNGEYACYTLKSGVFSGAGIIGLVSVLFGLVYYFIYVSSRSGAPDIELELEKQTVNDDKKPKITNTMTLVTKSH